MRRVRMRAEGESGAEEPPEVGSDAWRRRPASVRLPAGLQTPARTFALAAVLKLILLLSSTSTYAAVMRSLGFPHAAGPCKRDAGRCEVPGMAVRCEGCWCVAYRTNERQAERWWRSSS